MRRLGIVSVGLALVVGIVVGAAIGNPFGVSAQPPVPNPGHEWSAIGLPEGTWPGLDADMVDGQHVPDIVGNRALVEGQPFRLIDTSDGSVIATYPSVSKTVGLSCDGKLAALWGGEYGKLRFVETGSGSVLTASTDLWNQSNLTVLFPCPLARGFAAFNSGGPVSDRAVGWGWWESANRVAIWNLDTGEEIFTDTYNTSPRLNCANDTLMYSNSAATAVILVSLLDGSVIGSVPGTYFTPTC